MLSAAKNTWSKLGEVPNSGPYILVYLIYLLPEHPCKIMYSKNIMQAKFMVFKHHNYKVDPLETLHAWPTRNVCRQEILAKITLGRYSFRLNSSVSSV